MKKVDITLFHQEEGSRDCGLICVRMILNHFQIERSAEELIANHSYMSVGASMYQLGSYIIKEGLNVEIITSHPKIFQPDLSKDLRTDEDILYRFEESKKKLKTDDVQIIETAEEFIKSGGRMKIEIPSIFHIHSALDQGKALIALMFGGALGSNEGGFHFVVISGYRDGELYIDNPLEEAKQGWFPEQHVLYGIHASTCADLDNGTLLIADSNT